LAGPPATIAQDDVAVTTPDRDRRAAGLAKMQEIYGFSVDPDQMPGDYYDMMVDQLFGTVWTRDALTTRDRRLLTMGVLAALHQSDLLDLQFRSALERDELTEAQVREVVLHLTHYIGWPLSTAMNQVAEDVIARHQPVDHRAESDT
jgi:4-carboxymuconolactone decarboxylase